MSTRACVIAKNNRRGYYGIYVHLDGYPEGVGKILKEYYCDKNNVMKLISHGDASYLGKNLNECRFYHRDQNSPLYMGVFDSLEEAFEYYKNSWCEYAYVYDDETDDWIVYTLE